ncbi:hypothetical protein SAMN05216403_13320 [Nitrosospira multiformis ATCC 25196]|nr:hypothetical protein SAMN05216403_13320 [Nitrosospira multiformis ATCC 25196]
MRPSVALDMKRSAVREAVGRFRTANPRVFGSVLHGTDRDGSDLDLLVDALPGATLLDLGEYARPDTSTLVSSTTRNTDISASSVPLPPEHRSRSNLLPRAHPCIFQPDGC